MSVYNSQVTLNNISTSTVTIGTLVVDNGQYVFIWDTKSTNQNEAIWDNFNQVKDNHPTVYNYLTDGYIQLVQDGVYLATEQSLAILADMYSTKASTDDVNKLLSIQAKTDLTKEKDGRLTVTPTPIGIGWVTWFTGRGDNLSPTPPSSGRGEGTLMHVDIPDGYTYNKSDINFSAPVHIHDGQIYWSDGFTYEDSFSLAVEIPATPVTVNDQNKGNCDLVDTGAGFNMIIPSNNKGTHNLNLANAVPVTVYGEPTGHWDVEEETGVVRAADNKGKGGFNLYDADLPKVYFMKNIPMGHPHKVFDIDVYKTEYLHHKWTLIFEVNKVSSGSGWATGWVLLFRRNNT